MVLNDNESFADIKYMHTAVKEVSIRLMLSVFAGVVSVFECSLQGLEGTVEKNSPTLGRDAQYKKTSRISRLPGYLPVQFVRFFVGKAGDSEEIVAKKILKVCAMFSRCQLHVYSVVLIVVKYYVDPISVM